MEAPDARNDVLRTLHPPFHLFFHRPLGSTKSNLEHRTRVSSLTISSVDVVPDAVTRANSIFEAMGNGELAREREKEIAPAMLEIESMNSFIRARMVIQ